MFGSIEEAMKAYGVSKATIERKIAAGDIPSYRDGTGRRVWLQPFDGLKVTLEMLADEIRSLKREPQRVRAPKPVQANNELEGCEDETPFFDFGESPGGKVENDWELKEGVTIPPRCEALMLEASQLWTGSLRAFDKAAGLSNGFTSHVTAGRRVGRRAKKSWGKFEAFVEKLRENKG